MIVNIIIHVPAALKEGLADYLFSVYGQKEKKLEN
jgi:hypothetical protein